MDPIFETDFPADTAAITVPDAEVTVLGEHEGKFLVSCTPEVARSQGWRRRGDIEAVREAHYEQLGAALKAQMLEADAALAERQARELERQAFLVKAAADEAERLAAEEAARVAAENAKPAAAEPAAGDAASTASTPAAEPGKPGKRK